METNLPDAMNEAESLRALNWPVSRREELRSLLPSVPSGLTRLYQKSRVESLKLMSPEQLRDLRHQGALFTRNGPAGAPLSEIHKRTAEFTRGAIDPSARTVELSFSSEAPVARWFGNEILSHAAGAVRLGRLNNGAALLLDHDPAKQIGIVVPARIDPDGKGRAKVRFGNSALAVEIFQDVADGIRRLVSVGYRIHRQNSQGRSGGVELVRVTDWEPYEISLVSIPADDSVGVGRAISTHVHHQTENSNSVNREQLLAALRAANITYQDSMSDDQLRSLLPISQNGERQRSAAITGIAEQMRASNGINLDARSAIESGESADAFRERAYQALLGRQSHFEPGRAPSSGERDYGGNPGEMNLSGYSVTRAIRQAGLGRLDGLEYEVSQELARRAGKAPDGFFVPHAALMQRSGLSVTGNSGNNGGDAVGLSIGGFIGALRPMLMVAQAGATIMSGLSSNVGLPRQAAASTATWKAETADLDEKTPDIDQVLLSPKRVGAWTKLSKQLSAQSSPDVEAFVRLDLMEAIAVAFDYAAIAGTGTGDMPTGILSTSGIGSVAGGTNGSAPTWAHLVALVAAVNNVNAAGGRPAFMFSTKVEGKLRTTVKAPLTEKLILDDGQETLVGKPWYASNNVPDNLTKGSSAGVCSAIIYGNWAEVILASFGQGVDMIVDPFTLATSGQTRIVVNSLCDVGIRRATSFAAMKDALTA